MKNLIVMAIGKNTSVAFNEQLYRLLGNRVNIHCYYWGKNLPLDIKADLVLFSSKEAYAKFVLPSNLECPILIARRSINYHEVDKLFEIPAGTDVLLVNDLISATNETIALLQTLGINHINYHPYSPGISDFPNLQIAVTPGEREIVPSFVEKIIDIKTRQIDITTLVEILMKLNLLDFYADFLSANYVQDIIRLTKNSNIMMQESNKMKERFQTVINTVHDGIVATDEDGFVSVFNPIAEQLLDIRAEKIIGATVDNIKEKNLLRIINDKKIGSEALVTANGHGLIVNTAILHHNNDDLARVYTFKDVSEIQRLEERIRRKFVQEQKVARYSFSQITGKSKEIMKVLSLAEKMANSNATILIQGESGTGKELIAQGIHNASQRKNEPFIAVNFAALTENLLESELFGYIEGAFTGANRGGAPGLFEEAHKGTIFLDEIGDAPLPFQVKLLRVLQERQVRRIGSSKIIPIDVRVIVATNRDLRTLIAEGKFRQDLYYRLNVLPIRVPALRERADDILLLAKTFYENEKNCDKRFTAEKYFEWITPYLQKYNWPGNIRELQNVVEYLMNICPDTPPLPECLPKEIYNHTKKSFSRQDKSEQLEKIIFAEIKLANQNGVSIGRRSLAKKLSLPENQIRVLLKQMEEKNLILLQKGRNGLRAL